MAAHYVMQVHVGWLDNGTAVLAFRGTATMQDGMADVQIMHRSVHYLRKHFPGSRAHLGDTPRMLYRACGVIQDCMCLLCFHAALLAAPAL